MWILNNEEFNTTPEEYQGFVYQITELDTNTKYIGKRTFGNQRPYQSLKSVRDAYGHVRSLTGENIMAHPTKYADLWNHEDKISLKEK